MSRLSCTQTRGVRSTGREIVRCSKHHFFVFGGIIILPVSLADESKMNEGHIDPSDLEQRWV